MNSDDIEHLKDWIDVPFSRIAAYLLSSKGEGRKRINGIFDDLSIIEVRESWVFTHGAFPKGSITGSSKLSDRLTPRSVIP